MIIARADKASEREIERERERESERKRGRERESGRESERENETARFGSRQAPGSFALLASSGDRKVSMFSLSHSRG